jgi:excisionase family DNA binding protein
MNMSEEVVYKVGEVAEILKVSEGTVHTLLQEEKLKGFRIKRQWRINKSDLDTFRKVVAEHLG